jgi:hypothetical protein
MCFQTNSQQLTISFQPLHREPVFNEITEIYDNDSVTLLTKTTTAWSQPLQRRMAARSNAMIYWMYYELLAGELQIQ